MENQLSEKQLEATIDQLNKAQEDAANKLRVLRGKGYSLNRCPDLVVGTHKWSVVTVENREVFCGDVEVGDFECTRCHATMTVTQGKSPYP